MWTVRDVIAHLLSAEDGLTQVAKDIAAGGRGAPEGFDHNAYNAEEQARPAGRSRESLLAELDAARQATVAWVTELEDATLDLMGYHPALGKITLEQMITAIHGHQVMHIRELQAGIRS